MFFQKVFHVRQPLVETRRQLTSLASFRGRLPGLKKAEVSKAGAQIECTVDPRLDLHAILVELPTDEENQVVFQSTVGNVRVAGLIALTAIRPGVTEVMLAVDYSLCSIAGKLVDFCTRCVERYVENLLRALQGCLNGDQPGACRQVQEQLSAPTPQLAH
jgi:hypothetical protein